MNSNLIIDFISGIAGKGANLFFSLSLVEFDPVRLSSRGNDLGLRGPTLRHGENQITDFS